MVTLDSHFYLGGKDTSFIQFSKICQSSMTDGDTSDKPILEHSSFYPPTKCET